MKANSLALLNELITITKNNIATATQFSELPEAVLNSKPSADAWSILECLEHLNRYDRFYLPVICSHFASNQQSSKEVFRSGFIGNYLVSMVIPSPTSKKAKTFTSMNPSGNLLDRTVIENYNAGQQQLLQSLEQAKSHDLNKSGITVTFSKLVKLKLGDILRFMVYHNLRHIQQAQRNIVQQQNENHIFVA